MLSQSYDMLPSASNIVYHKILNFNSVFITCKKKKNYMAYFDRRQQWTLNCYDDRVLSDPAALAAVVVVEHQHMVHPLCVNKLRRCFLVAEFAALAIVEHQHIVH